MGSGDDIKQEIDSDNGISVSTGLDEVHRGVDQRAMRVSGDGGGIQMGPGVTIYSKSNRDTTEDVEPVAMPQKQSFGRIVYFVAFSAGSAIRFFVRLSMPSLRPKRTCCGPSKGPLGTGKGIDIMPSRVADKDLISASAAAAAASAPVPLWRAIFVLVACVGYVGILASIIVSICERLVGVLGIGTSTIGATLVALGSEVGR